MGTGGHDYDRERPLRIPAQCQARPPTSAGVGFAVAIPAGIAIGVGIVAGYVLARYGFGLDLIRSRTVATGIVVVCGLAIVMRLETEGGRRRLAVAGLCVLMALLFGVSLIVPFLRHFYELATPGGDMLTAWALGIILGVGGMLAALRLIRV